MAPRRSLVFYGLLIALASLVAGMVIASRLEYSPLSSAGDLSIPATNSAPIDGAFDATTFRRIADAASPSVVSIRTTSLRPARVLELPFGIPEAPRGRRPAPAQRVTAAGSGFIIDKAGFLLTNNHVVQDASTIEVKLAGMADGEPWLPAKLVGRDPLTDSALIQLTKVPEDPLVAARFGDSSKLGPGDWVMAIGNPFRLSNTVTVGVVSAVGRLQPTAIDGRAEEMIQTDAAINQGNSGGPLLNLRGEVVGINTMIVSDQIGGGNLGIGFAIPINSVVEILPQLHKGKVVRGLIGVGLSGTPITREDARDLGLPGASGATVSQVNEGGPAHKAGLRIGDVIVEFNGKLVRDNSTLVSMVTRTAPGTTVPVTIVRARKTMTLNVRIGEFDSEQQLVTQNQAPSDAASPSDTGLDMRIETITPAIARQLELPAGRGGAVVSEVEPSGAAAQGGLRPGDVIIAVNDETTTSVSQVRAALDRIASGRLARLFIWRAGQELLVQVRKP